jgi:hypothetical protein
VWHILQNIILARTSSADSDVDVLLNDGLYSLNYYDPNMADMIYYRGSFNFDIKMETKENILDLMMQKGLPFLGLMSKKFSSLMSSREILEKNMKECFLNISSLSMV